MNDHHQALDKVNVSNALSQKAQEEWARECREVSAFYSEWYGWSTTKEWACVREENLIRRKPWDGTEQG